MTEPALLPPALLVLWRAGGGLLTASGVAVYGPEDLGERNTTYEVARYAPGFLLFGDDSGGRGFLLRAGDPHSPVYSSDFGDLDPDDFETEAPDFPTWFASLAP
ncbi:hypothetical protein [Kitasatospora sp. McL0602]|uniref:hypothetical protein n=1 Tax=Kitasatospora sp. McL0602 TaxID=3439530 RepID=UPI003F8C5E84